MKNCKKHCAGYALILEASFLERDEEPCDDIKQIAKDIKKCAKESCGEDRYACIDEAEAELYECWPYDYEPYEYDGAENETIAVERDIDEAELTSRMLYGAFADDPGETNLAE